MSAYDSTTTGQILKEVFDKGTVKDTVYPDNPLYAMLKKQQTGGTDYAYPVQYELPGGRSRSIVKSLAGKRPAKFVKFQMTLVKDYNSISIDRMFMFQTAKDEYAFIEARTREVQGMLKQLVRSLAMGLYRGTGGSCGKIAAGGISSATITLDDLEEICNFAVGDVLVVGANNGDTSTDTLRTGSLTVTSVDRDLGTITCSANITTGIPLAAAGDFLFKDGDFQASIAGLAAWAPATAPGSTDSFYGANRYPDVTRLAGVRVSAIGDPITEAIAKACSRLGREGAMPKQCFMSFAKMRDLILELNQKVEYEVTTPEDATVGFKGVKFVSPNGTVTCYADHNCPNKKLYVTDVSAARLLYTGDDVPELQDEDGSLLCREPGSDGFEVRASYYANMCFLEPNQTANVTLEA